MAKPTGAELAKINEDSKYLLDAQQAKELKTIEDIQERFGGRVYDVTEVMPDYSLVDSSTLVGVPFTVAHFEVRMSDEFGHFENGLLVPGKYVSVFVITNDGKKLVFNDGGAGILPAAENFIEVTRQTGGMRCPWGLRASSYEKVVNDQKIKATTMYFATSAPKTS